MGRQANRHYPTNQKRTGGMRNGQCPYTAINPMLGDEISPASRLDGLGVGVSLVSMSSTSGSR